LNYTLFVLQWRQAFPFIVQSGMSVFPVGTVHPRFSGPRLTGPSTNRPGSTGRYIQLFILKSTRFTMENN